jgi:hypothetical protein
MKLRSLILRVIFAWVPILPPPALVAKPQVQPSPRIFFGSSVSADNSFHALSEPQDHAHRHCVSRPSRHIASAESRGI